MKQFSDRVAVITGAGGGIGSALAAELYGVDAPDRAWDGGGASKR